MFFFKQNKKILISHLTVTFHVFLWLRAGNSSVEVLWRLIFETSDFEINLWNSVVSETCDIMKSLKLKLTLSSSCSASALCEYCLPAPFPATDHFLSLSGLPQYSFCCLLVSLELCAYICYERASILLMILSRNIFKSSKFVVCFLT